MTKQLLLSMRYKGFTFPYNPSTCKYSAERAYVRHKYPELAGAEIEDMETDAVIFTGDGEFVGTNAYNYWRQLEGVFNEYGVGEFFHPVFTNASKALMTKLTATLEPRQDYVSYSFEFVIPKTVQWIRTAITGTDVTHDTDKSVTDNNRVICVGDTVICNGYAYYTSYGANPHSAKMTNKTMCVTHVNYKGTHPICVGVIGWMRLCDITLGNTTSAPNTSSNSTYKTYTVKSGDTLSGIGKKFCISWKKIASFNGIKNPNIIYVGDVIKIPN